MFKQDSTAESRESGAPRGASIHEVREFVRLRAGGCLVPVLHQRTIYHPDGRISRELASPTEVLVEQMIRAFQGYAHQNGETVSGFFDDPGKARDCARAISDHHKKPVEVYGTQITIAL